jgi:hypothetical protein
MAAVGTKESSLEASKVTLRPGAVHRLTLGGLGGAGYAWDQSIEGLPGVVRVSVEPAEAPALPPPGGPPPNNSSRDDTYIITALKPGTAQVRFFLHRPWERDKPPLREVVVDVSVSP